MDYAYLLGLQNLRQGLGEEFSKVLNAVTSLFINPVLYLVFALVYWCINKRKGIFYIFCLAGGNFFSAILKTAFCIFRPWLMNKDIVPYPFTLEDATGYSFPSGHSTAAVAIFGATAWIEQKRKRLVWICIGLCLVIGFSRNFLGVHTPQDVLAGFAIGAVCIFAFTRLLPWVDQKPGRDSKVTLFSLVLITGGLLFTALREYPLTLNGEQVIDSVASATKDTYTAIGIAYGLIIGWFAERKWIRFEITGTVKERILHGILGAAGVGIVNLLPKTLLYSGLGEDWGRLVLYFITVFYVMVGWPWIEKRFFKKEKA